METTLSSRGISFFFGLFDLEYAGHVLSLGEDQRKLQVFLNDRVGMFGMHFTPLKCWIGSKPNLFVTGQGLVELNRSNYLGIPVTPIGHISDDASSSMQKARFAFSNLGHLWRRCDIRLSIKNRVFSAAPRQVLLCGSKTWLPKASDVWTLSVFVEYGGRTLPVTQKLGVRYWVLVFTF